jgi:hypothetical protein
MSVIYGEINSLSRIISLMGNKSNLVRSVTLALIRAAELCVRTWPPEECLVALVSGYFDDSQSTGDVWVVGGYVGYLNQWDHFEQLWGSALDKHEVPYFHMREMADPSGPFAKWLPPEAHQDERTAFFVDLTGAINKCGLHMFVSAAWVPDVDRFNRDKGITLEPYPLAAYTCMSNIALHYHRLPVTMTFDSVEKLGSKLITARRYADSNMLAPRLCDYIVATPLPNGLNSKIVRPMQAADFIAWETRKAFFNMKEWQLLLDRPITDRMIMWNHYLRWVRERTGKDPVLRKSMDALMSNMSTNAVVWDYHQLDDMHRARNGIWGEDDSEK